VSDVTSYRKNRTTQLFFQPKNLPLVSFQVIGAV